MRFCGERLLIPTALCPHRSFGYAPWEDPGGHKVNETGGGGGGGAGPHLPSPLYSNHIIIEL